MNEKEKVIKAFPEARSHSWADCWCIYSKPAFGEVLGEGKTKMAAWQDAYDKRVRFKKKKNTAPPI